MWDEKRMTVSRAQRREYSILEVMEEEKYFSRGEILAYWKEYSLQRVLTDWQKDLTFPYFVDFEEKIAKKN